MLVVFAFMTFGFAFAFRIRAFSLAHRLSSRETLTKIGTLSFSLAIFAVARFADSTFQVWCASLFPAAVFLTWNASENRRRETRFRSEFYACVNGCILRMKAGEGFRTAFDGAIQDSDARARPRLRELRDVVVFSQQAGSFARTKQDSISRSIAFAARELALADRDSHSAIRRCCALRDRIRIEHEFRRKSGQATQQARAQSLILAGLYLATLVFVGAQFGFREHLQLFGVSFALFACGLAWTQAVGRRLDWKT